MTVENIPPSRWLQPWEFRAATDRRSAWACFLAAVAAEAPEVLTDLRDTVLPVFLRAVADEPSIITAGPDTVPPDRLEQVKESVTREISRWARRHRLCDPDGEAIAIPHQRRSARRRSGSPGSPSPPGYVVDLLEVVYRTLTSWAARPDEAGGRLDWTFPHEPIICWAEYVSFQVQDWDPTSETRQGAAKRIGRSLAEQLRQHLNRCEEEAIAGGNGANFSHSW